MGDHEGTGKQQATEDKEAVMYVDNVREQILKAAIRKYGPGAQRDKAIEELSELIRALARCDDKENVAEEMADVRIMLDQLEIIFGNGQKVARWEVMKLRRLDQRVHAADVIGEVGERRGAGCGRGEKTSSDPPSAAHLPHRGKAFGEPGKAGGREGPVRKTGR